MILARAPLRIALGGGGTDLPSYYREHGGFVLAAAIDKYVYVCVNRPASDDLIRLKYSRSEEVSDLSEIQHDLVRPALRHLGIERNIEIASMADVPAGTGLGSSGSYLVALLAALHEVLRRRIAPQELAELAVYLEMEIAGHACGKQDQYMASFGGVTCLDIAQDGTVSVSPAPISVSTLEELQGRLMLLFTGVSREADVILAEQRRDSERGDARVLESLRHTKEIGAKIYAALHTGRLDDFGQLMHEHWETKKRRSTRISDHQVDRWYDIARRAGALGGKVAGAGGGGFLMLYCPEGTKRRVREALATEGLREMPFAFDHQGAKIMVNI